MILGYILGGIIVLAFIVYLLLASKNNNKQNIQVGKNESQNINNIVRSLRSIKSQPIVQQPTEEIIIPTRPEGKYKAMIWTVKGIIFGKIPEPIGAIFNLDPTMPQHGEHYWVVEKIENNKYVYEPFDPRDIPLIYEEMPEWAYDSINCKEQVWDWYKNPIDTFAKINSFIIGLAIICMTLVCFVGLDTISKMSKG